MFISLINDHYFSDFDWSNQIRDNKTCSFLRDIRTLITLNVTAADITTPLFKFVHIIIGSVGKFPSSPPAHAIDRVARLPRAPCLPARGNRLGGIAFYHANGSCRAIPACRDEINHEDMAARGEFFRNYHLQCYLPNRMTVILKISM